MRILVTNDDGINGEGFAPLVNWAKKLGEVTVLAPKHEQSGKSQAINLISPFEVKKVSLFDGIEAYSVDSTPVDCVRFGIYGLKRKYDLVLSGINRGHNIGADILYSGTCGAIFEASKQKTKAIAFSTGFDSFDYAVSSLDRIYSYIIDNKLFEYNDIYNVNIPTSEASGICLTHQGGPYYEDNFKLTEPNMYLADGFCFYQKGYDLDLDTDAVINGYISVSPVTIVRTEMDAYRKLKKLGL